MKTGELREQIWSELVRHNACAYPLPPHGHNPNFKGARAAAKKLLEHDLLRSARVVLVGMEAALLPMRQLLLESGQVVIVPHRTKAGAYWRLENAAKSAARIENFHVFGEACDLGAVQVAVLASVAVDLQGRRLSKGFGFGARGAPKPVPTLTLAHPTMVLERLEVEVDSRINAFATPKGLVRCI
jgi:5-formyltetrahydrofolate cyclo-ligase